MKKSLLVLLCMFAFLETKAQDSNWMYDFGSASSATYTSTTYSTAYLPVPTTGGGNAGVRASSATEGQVELTTAGLAGGSGAELKMTGGTTVVGAKFGLAPFTGTTVGTFECKVNFVSGTNGRFVLLLGNGANFTSGNGISVAQTFAALRFSPGASNVSLDWLLSSTSPNYTTAGLTQTTITKNQSHIIKFFMNNSNSNTTYIVNSIAHTLTSGTFDIWLDGVKILANANPGTGTLAQGTIINGMNFLNVGAGSSTPVMCIDDINYTNYLIATPPPVVTNTILNVDYESGTLNSGISDISSSHATAPDANYMVQPGATGNWAIAHKIVHGNPSYVSDGSLSRSESDAVAIPAARFFPGDERRYEFSVLLKDWTPWISGDTYETNIFQLKVSGNTDSGSGVPLQFRTSRNAMRLRYEGSTSLTDIITDLGSYVNQWMSFRIDVLWKDDATGYMRTYMKLPGQNDYVLVDEKTNYRTFAGNVSIGNLGYIKWGVYDAQAGLTRIAYHDDIRIFELNNNSNPIALWDNSITDNNPAYLPGSYSPTNDLLATNVVSSNTSPSSDFSRSTLTPAGGATLGGRYLLGGWATGSTNAPSPFDDTQYYEFKIAPKPGYQLNLKNMKFNWRTGGTTHPNTYVLRSSLDNFTSNISAPVTVSDDTANNSNFGNSSIYDLANILTTSETTFRMYWYGATATNTLVGIDNFTFNGNTRAVESNLQIETKNNVTKKTDNTLSTYTTQSNEFDVTATGNCGSITYSYTLTGATTAVGTGSLANKVFNNGETKVTWTATDGCNNSTNSFTITVKDEEKPVITTPESITINNDTGQCSATTTLSNPVVSDNCGVANIVNNAPTTFPIGSTIVTWIATDVNGNIATATQIITVIDAEAPIVNSTASISLCYEASGNYSIPAAIATDNCNVNSITYQITGTTIRNGNGLDASGNFNVGISTINWTVTDNSGNSSSASTTVTINSEIAVSIADVYAVNPGGNANTIYLGYGPSSLTLTATPINGKAPYTYLWNNDATTPSIPANPSTAGVHIYTATITDALGCIATITKEITVTDIRCANKKVSICHNNSNSLCVSTNAVSAHLAHGCSLGSCDNTNLSYISGNELIVTVAPNPTKTEFHMKISGAPNLSVLVTIFDISGRKIKQFKTNPDQIITTGSELIPGIYIAEIIQGNDKKTVKLIKQ